jgi:uncharacterized SAM-binding protein YcdF (DUF218 family)
MGRGDRLLQAVGALGLAAFLLVAFTPMPNVLARWDGEAPEPTPADAIVVLAASVSVDGALSDDSLRRAVHGILLYRQGLAPLLVFSGTVLDDLASEAAIRAEMAHRLGIPAAALLTESTARTTREEALRMAELLQPRGVHRILLVTDRYHMRRSRGLFERAGFRVHPAPVDNLSHAQAPEQRLRLMRHLAQEALARAYYGAAGYL